MSPDRVQSLASGDGLLIIEGAMGLFDGAPPTGQGATADLARILGLPVVLVIDAARMAQSVAPLVAGFAAHDPAVNVAGVILNRVGSPRHEAMLRRALQAIGIVVLGAVSRDGTMVHPSRHLGLVQAGERGDLEEYLEHVAATVSASVDLQAVRALASSLPSAPGARRFPPPAQNITIAQDQAFSFAYPHLLNDWQNAGATLSFFSPLNDEAPHSADMVYLPGGYPELHAGKLAAAGNFCAGMRAAAKNARIYAECGGYMVMGEGLVDADGHRHQMLGLLSLETSFAARKLHLGYRSLTPLAGPFAGPLKAHEFHYATTLKAEGEALFNAEDAEGLTLPAMGLSKGGVCGSFAHVIDQGI
jgi:cobyrinic acid a,c-diamide synthase